METRSTTTKTEGYLQSTPDRGLEVKKTPRLFEKAAAFGLEFIVVISGVLAAFWLSSWVERQNEKEVVVFYLQELTDSLEMDRQQLDEVIREQENRRRVLDDLLRTMPEADSSNKHSIDSLFASIRGNRTFFPANGAYKALVAEGSLDLVSNKELVTSLVELYEYYYVRAVYLGTVLDGEAEKTNWERRKFFSMYDNKFHDLQAIRSKELRAIEEHRHAYIGVYLGHAADTSRKIAEVKALLESELQQLR